MIQQNSYPTLKNAPIEEAIISLSVGKGGYHSISEVSALCDKFKKYYPNSSEVKKKPFSSHFGETTDHQQNESLDGFLLTSEDKKKLINITKNNLSMHHLRPYSNWENFVADYKYAWGIYAEPLSVKEISSLSIRYINKFLIPMKDSANYLLMHPTINSTNDFDDSAFFTDEVFSRYILLSERHAAKSMVLLNLKASNQPDKLEVVLDIDVQAREPVIVNTEFIAIVDVLNRLRAFKNHIFFSNVPKYDELFND